jgi:hypothetical protein
VQRLIDTRAEVARNIDITENLLNMLMAARVITGEKKETILVSVQYIILRVVS